LDEQKHDGQETHDGKPLVNEPGEKRLCVKSEEDVMIELTRKPAAVMQKTGSMKKA